MTMLIMMAMNSALLFSVLLRHVMRCDVSQMPIVPFVRLV